MRVPAAEIDIDEGLVRALLQAQHPDLAGLPLVRAADGWDNVMWRLGPDLAVRLPQRALGAGFARVEHRWLPELARAVAADVPAPVRIGTPTGDYPWTWAIVPWFEGRTADVQPLSPDGVRSLGWALHTLHTPAPADAPVNPYRGVGLVEREDPLPGLEALYDGAVPPALRRGWLRALEAEAVSAAGRPLWVHGDLHARNLVVSGGGDLRAIIDWGDLGAGDPAVDLSCLWTVLEPGQHGLFCAGYGPVDGPLLGRARGWALVFATIFASLEDDPGAVAIGRRTLGLLQG
ncbi:hypothetical protein DSM112329_02347 [Paraconexibacter sp. AEG42_29]|uniref:Aminoglycoside phosphotransferase domain-containing protein n=1 Tax=Paraconexibacter sp. AEG42_29 TaxID=2997339 RepID=A0AAU7AV60_9ACTN